MKDINTPRDELICGKIDLCIQAIQNNEPVTAIELLGDIRYDAQRMEQKLIERKKQCYNADFWDEETKKLPKL